MEITKISPQSSSIDWQTAMALAAKAVYGADGRGTVGAGRLNLTNRVAQAIFAAANPAPASPDSMEGEDQKLVGPADC